MPNLSERITNLRRFGSSTKKRKFYSHRFINRWSRGFGGAWALLEELGNDFKSLIGEADEVADFVLSHSRQPLQGTPTIMIFNPNGILVAFQGGPVPVDSIEVFIAQRSN